MESNSTDKLSRQLKKVLKETKKNKENLLIEQSLVKNRIINIFGSEENLKNINRLSERKKIRLALALMEEIRFLDENQILNEQLGDFLGKIFGGAMGSFLETLVEPLVNSVLSGLGITGFFKNFLVSALTSNPRELARALSDCKTLTTLIANSLGEAMFMMIQEKKGLEGGFYTFLRNALGGAVKDTAFVNKIEDFIGDFVCKAYSNLTGKAEQVYNKLKPVAGAATTTATPQTTQ